MSEYIDNLKSVSKNRILAYPPKHPFDKTISRKDIKQSLSALDLEKFRKV